MTLSRSIIAYFSMEIGLDSDMATYSGGLGVLAGDTVRAAADVGLNMVAVTLLTREGYFRQALDAAGNQHEYPASWAPGEKLTEMPERVAVHIEGREVQLRAWRYEVVGVDGHRVPVYFLDSDLDGNDEGDRRLTHQLYGGDERYRLCQEVILGMGGRRMLRALGHTDILRYHMNEGHAALLSLELLAEQANGAAVTEEHLNQVRRRCVFTTHTPVQAGHDRFSLELVRSVLGGESALWEVEAQICCGGALDLTMLALHNSNYINGVAKRHGEVSRAMYGQYTIDSITNGVHAASWVSPAMADLFDRYIPDWRKDNASLRTAIGIPLYEIGECHFTNKCILMDHVRNKTGIDLDASVLTLGFARRATAYKRLDLLFADIDRLQAIVERAGPLQIIYSGKAHPRDHEGKQLIAKIFEAARQLRGRIEVIYLEDYDMALGRLLTAGVDVWLNTPHPPMEASGTSGMKAALNGVPSFSVLDGWWVEGCIEGITGWSLGEPAAGQHDGDRWWSDAEQLYAKLESDIMPLYYGDPEGFTGVMRSAIFLNGSFFNTERMIREYVAKAYFH
ncbi:MAG: alpha-glucan family phosphorylase [Bacteroidales bacterium]|nr:alpha-glucan family phosphorylase [Bacteroidales bacterium]